MLSTDINDWPLLREYVERRSEAAFETLVRRHLDMEYSAAWPQTGDADLTEEAAQVVFVLLARKARRLRTKTGSNQSQTATERYYFSSPGAPGPKRWPYSQSWPLAERFQSKLNVVPPKCWPHWSV